MGNWFTGLLDDVSNFFNDLDRLGGLNPLHTEVEWKDSQAVLQEEESTPGGLALTHSMESFFQGWKYVRDNYISQPLSTTILHGAIMREEEWNPLSAAQWSRAWRAAEHISPTQAFGLSDEERIKAIESPPVYYKPPAGQLPAGFEDLPEDEQQRFLKEAGMPAIGSEFVEQMREDSWLYKYGTGVGDFALAWFADPLIVGGKVAGGVRAAKTVKRRPAGGWSPEEIDKIVNSSRFGQLIDFLQKNADNGTLVNNTDFAMKTIGPRMGAINSVLRGREERFLFARTGMGDVRAMRQLKNSNALARARMESDTSRLAAIDVMHARYAGARDPRMAALAEKEIDRLNEAIAADTAMVQRYEQILQHADEIDEIRLSRWSFARAEQRTEAQLQYLARPARGGKVRRQFKATTTPMIGRIDPATGRPATREVESGFVKTRLWGVSDFFSTPVTVVRMMKNAHPSGYMALDQGAFADAANITELRAQLARIPGLKAKQRGDMLNQYLKTTSEAERKDFLEHMNRMATGAIAAKHGLTAKIGLEIYEAQRQKLLGEVDRMQQFSAAAMPREGAPPLRVDVFDAEGGVKVAPHTVTRIMQSHVLPDLEQFNRVLSRHASALKAIRASHAGNPDWILSAGDYLNHLWKWATLFRVGYIPRTVGDDLASQWARLGTAAMALRAGYGVKNAVTNLAHREQRTFNQLKEKMHVQEMEYAKGELKLIEPEMRKLGGRMAAERAMRRRDLLQAENRLGKAEVRLENLPADATPAQRRAVERFVQSKRNELARARARAEKTVWPDKNIRLRDLELRAATLEHFHNLSARAADEALQKQQKVFQGANAVKVGDVVFPAAFGGQRGDYFMKRISPDTAYDQLFRTPKDLMHANLMRSFDHGARPISAVDDPVKHADAWTHAINAQIAQDKMQRMLVAGRPEEEVVQWLKATPEGKAYWKRLGRENSSTPEEVVAKGRFEVDEYLPLPEIRAQALTPEGVSPESLTKAIPKVTHRPVVHMANVGNVPLVQLQTVDRIMQFWYKWFVTQPSKTFSRHPLFNQLYEGHLKTITAQRELQGAKVTVKDVDQITEASRRLAERDMKRLVFDIAHRSDAAAALRFAMPFFSATAESFQRWGRVIADKPETVGYAANFYNAPAYMGHLQDQEGNRIFPDGTVVTIDPKTGKAVKKLAPKADRWIVGRMPDWLIDSPIGVMFGVERSSGNFTLSQNSMNVVTQGDPWYSPGFGPIVQIPVNEFVKDMPEQAEVARHLGVLPFGPATDGTLPGRALRAVAPATVRNFLTAFDTSDHRYQQVKMQILQRAIFEHEEHGKPMLTPQEIADRTRNYWFFSAGSAFLQPMATKKRDAYQFWRDQYRNLQRANPKTADQEFLNRFGEEYFLFAQSMSKNVAGIQATRKAVELSKEYADVLAEFPELGPLIIGPEGNGPFSPEAYAYQLNTPLVPGDAESQRRRLSAEEAIEENERRKGWAKFSQVMNWINHELVKQNLPSLEAEGAERLALVKKALVMALGDPTMPKGEENPNYNEQWSEDYYSLDAKKYDRMIPRLGKVAAGVLKKDPERGDMRHLLMYLEGRKYFVETLKQRPFKTLGARANTDLRRAWTGFVGSLTEKNTDFGDLHSRYLSRDLGVDIDEEVELMTLAEEEEAAV
ncbi:AAA family ATPase [Streptomyces halobius]|uniref:Large polyvalent protein associated domain-containing protein n=1 Tax=Streptomyces halobius TaxID=2879846 RepID=A0ABY4M1K8_9ACTN|nr:hypothetical protein [Streptomyces halobius]UQA91639.1 hypothetical protein K9S39_06990 [Streptomyces halobius]